MKTKAKKVSYRFRDAETGRMVKAGYAAKHSTTTVRERIKR